MVLRGSIPGAKGGGVLVGWGVHVVAVLDLVSQVLVDGAGLVADFDLSEARHPQEEILIVDETVIVWQTLVVVPHFPVHAVEEWPLCELQDITLDICLQQKASSPKYLASSFLPFRFITENYFAIMDGFTSN